MTWPADQSDALDAFYTRPDGTAKWEIINLTFVLCPWKIYTSWDPPKEYTQGIKVHKKVADSLSRVLKDIWARFNYSQAEIEKAGMHRLGGSYHYRPKRGSRNLSLHAYGAAIDWDPVHNAMKDGIPGNHKMDKRVVQAFEKEGWRWGNAYDDPMHFEAVYNGNKVTFPEKSTEITKLPGGEVVKQPIVTPNPIKGTFKKVGNYVARGEGPIDKRLVACLEKAAIENGYNVEAYSGFRPGDKRFHGKGMAVDVRILGPDGKEIPNYQSAKGFRIYEKYAQHVRLVQLRDYPELTKLLRWGGYFSGKPGVYGALDLMHFDLGGATVGMAGGSWDDGLTKLQRSYYPGVESIGLKTVIKEVAKDIVAEMPSPPKPMPPAAQTFHPESRIEGYISVAIPGIKRWEAFMAEPYWDVKQWAIGYGHGLGGTKDVKPVMKVTEAEASEMLHDHLKKVAVTVFPFVKVPLTLNQGAAILSFAYNLGTGALATSTLLKLINSKEYNLAAERFEEWVNITYTEKDAEGKLVKKKKSLPGLVKRRKYEKALFLTPEGTSPPDAKTF